MNPFPAICNGGKEIFIDNKPAGTISVSFYIDRGFIDHYSKDGLIMGDRSNMVKITQILYAKVSFVK